MSAHAWVPVSPCGHGCVERDENTVGVVRAAGRVAGIAGLFGAFPVVNRAVWGGARERMQRRFAAGLLRCCGVEVRVVDNRVDSPGRSFGATNEGVSVISGHVGWIDTLVLAAVQPVSFVARADLLNWPLLGGVAARMRVIPIERAKLRELPAVVDEIAVRLAAGERVAIFPEGTTWCGRAYGGLRPALLQAAVDTGTPLQPVRLRYLRPEGQLCTTPAFVGADTIVGSLLRLIRTESIVAEVVLEPREYPHGDRRELAARCERAVRGRVELDFAAHGVLESDLRNAPAPVPARVS